MNLAPKNAAPVSWERLEQVRTYLRDYPASVIAISYAGDAPPLVRLDTLITRKQLASGTTADPVLLRFTERLKKARPDLSLEELLQLSVPVSAGDQEVYTARLGKWLFEVKMLGRALSGS